MRCIYLFLIIFSIYSVFAHEEPPKTLWELKVKEEKRHRIIKAGISKIIRWKVEIKDGVPTGNKYKNLIYEYDKNGNLTNLKLFENDSLVQEVHYFFNNKNQMIIDLDFDSNGKLTELIVYEYNADCCVKKGIKFNDTGKLIEVATFNLSPDGKSLLQRIEDTNGVILKSYVFKYEPNSYESDYFYAAQYEMDKEILQVEKVYIDDRVIIEKRIKYTDTTKNITHLYKGSSKVKIADEIITIEKQTGLVKKIELRKFNSDFFETELIILNGDRKIISMYNYTFEEWKQ